jgi:hypothetical protein
MRCMAANSRRRGIWLGRVAACLLIVGIAAAQAPTVPTDHYGPPVCGVTREASPRMTAAAARAEQELGARNARALLSDEPLENFGIERYRLADYADCVGSGGCYWADLDAQYKRAETALAARIAATRAGSVEKLAVVMDIDDTTLSSYCEMKREAFGYVGPMFNGWTVTPEAAVAIPGAQRLFQEARAAGLAVFFITGRPGVQPEASERTDQTAATAKNLVAAGFHGWAGLALRDGAENGMATIAYKAAERQKIVAKGYRIVLSVGDQWSDLLGDPQAGLNVKLPNPFYFLP